MLIIISKIMKGGIDIQTSTKPLCNHIYCLAQKARGSTNQNANDSSYSHCTKTTSNETRAP